MIDIRIDRLLVLGPCLDDRRKVKVSSLAGLIEGGRKSLLRYERWVEYTFFLSLAWVGWAWVFKMRSGPAHGKICFRQGLGTEDELRTWIFLNDFEIVQGLLSFLLSFWACGVEWETRSRSLYATPRNQQERLDSTAWLSHVSNLLPSFTLLGNKRFYLESDYTCWVNNIDYTKRDSTLSKEYRGV